MPTSIIPETPHQHSADRPLQHLAEDGLERAGFAQRLADDISGWHGEDSLVIRLNGDWGSGKTTLKNFVKERLLLRGNPLVIEFNPWQWSGQDKLFEAFFSSIRTGFGETDRAKETQDLVARWERLEAWTRFGAEISTKVEKAIAPLLGGSVALALMANTAPQSWIQTTGVSVGLVGVVLSSFLAIFPDLAGQYVTALKSRMGIEQKPLAQLRRDIIEQLEKLRKIKRPVLIIIDDIDRLSQEEIRLLVQLVKANADFPNLVFLLLFQKNIVVDALSKVVADSGSDYLKKIVQVEFDLPQASRARMLKIFQESLNKVFARNSPEMQWDKDRATEIFEDHLWPYFRTLRDVKRFIGTFDFYFHGQVNNGVLEVNPIDLLAIEVLRLFDHEGYLMIRESFGYLARSNIVRLLVGDEERKQRVKLDIDAVVNRATLDQAEKERLRAILHSLFPGEKTVDAEFMAKAERDLRICHPKHFTKYFEHVLDNSPTSAANMRDLLRLVTQRDKFAERLRELCHTNTLEDVFEKLQLYTEEIPPESAESFTAALCDVGDEMPEERVDWFNQDPIREAGKMIYHLLKKLPDNPARARLLTKCFLLSKGVAVPVMIVALLEPDKEDKGRPRLIDEADWKLLRQDVLERIESFAKSGHIWSSRHFALFIYRWRDWAGQPAVNSWLLSEMKTAQRKLDFVVRMLGRSSVNGHRIEYSIDGKSLETFTDIDALSAEVGSIPPSTDDKEIIARKIVARVLALKKSGSHYSRVGLPGQFD